MYNLMSPCRVEFNPSYPASFMDSWLTPSPIAIPIGCMRAKQTV